jgi:hypothetical protein
MAAHAPGMGVGMTPGAAMGALRRRRHARGTKHNDDEPGSRASMAV